jgi:hypothetical protein
MDELFRLSFDQAAHFDTEFVDLHLEQRHPIHLSLELFIDVLDLSLDEGQNFHAIS